MQGAARGSTRTSTSDLQKQVAPYCTEVYRCTFDEIFVPTPAHR